MPPLQVRDYAVCVSYDRLPLHGMTAQVFVGRDRELTELNAGLDDALSGCGRFFLLFGEPGIGKTRLADEVAARAAQRGARVLWGRCWEGGGAPAYWPWVQIIRSYVRSCDRETLKDQLGAGAPYVAEMVPELRAAIGETGTPTAASLQDSEHARFYLFDAATQFLKNVSAERPLVLIFDDLHAADQPSLLLLRFLARERRESHILAIATYRDAEVRRAPPIAEVLGEIGREASCLPLGGLRQAEVARFIEEATGQSPSKALASSLHLATEGNPFFVNEIVRLLLAEDRIHGSGPAAWKGFRIPDEVRQAVRRRLSPLSTESKSTLTLAAVVGRDFRLAELAAITGSPADRLLEVLGDSLAAGIIVEGSAAAGRYRFFHAVIRDTLYDDLRPAERVRLHLQAAEALEELYRADPEPHLAELAHHFLRAIAGGGLDRAIAYARRAGMQEMGRLAYEEAAAHFERALEAFDLEQAPDEQERCELLLALGEAQSRAGDPERARSAFRRAVEIARRLGASETLARAALGLGGRGYTDIGIVDAPLTELLEEALAALGERNEPLRARLLARLAEELVSSFAPATRERGGALSGEAVLAARRASDPRSLAKALHARFFALWGPDTVVERLELTTEMVSVAEEGGDKDMAFMGRVRRLITLVETDDIAALDSEVAALTRLADELREPTHRWNLLEIRGGLALREGRFDEAERFIHQTFALGEQLQKVDAGPIFTGQLLALRRARGRADEMEAAIRSQIEQFPEIAYWRCELALLRCELGREAEARVEFEQIAAHDFLDLPRNFVWLGSIAVLSQVAALLGDRRRAASLYDLLLPYEKRWVALGTAWSWGAATRYLGLLSATMGRYADAARHFEDAQAMSARIRAVPFLALTQSDYARMLLARGEPGDREKGAELLGRAATVAESLGMKVLLERARTLGTTPQIAGPEAAKTAEQNVFRKEGDYWTIVYDGETVRLKDSKGLGYIAYLLQHPGTEFHAAELLGTLDGRSDAGDAGALLDPKAKAAYRRRLEELRKETEEAERFNDPGRASNARREMELLSGQLAAAIGLGGRDRKAASGAERARLTVTKRIKAVVEKIRERNQAFGRHLAKNLKTGYFCSYTPEHPVPWQN